MSSLARQAQETANAIAEVRKNSAMELLKARRATMAIVISENNRAIAALDTERYGYFKANMLARAEYQDLCDAIDILERA